MAVELWTMGRTRPQAVRRQAAEIEAAGWDGLLVPDTQNLAGDPYVSLALAADATEHLGLGTGVTNPYTRHAAVTASAAATLQVVSRGRMVLGIGRGDSALAHLGLAPTSPDAFAEHLDRLQAYLRGEAVGFGPVAPGLRSVQTLAAASHPDESRLRWLDAAVPKVPVDVSATGPKVIALAATRAERLSFAVGADPSRLQAAIELARGARRDAGLVEDELSFGAWLNVVPHPDRATGCDLASAGAATFSRFSIMHGRSPADTDTSARSEYARLSAAYDLNEHGLGTAAHRRALTPGFIERFAVVGDVRTCVERLQELAALGLRRIVIMATAAEPSPELALSNRLLVEEVLPGVRG